ncbi:MAG TPA: L-glutamate gamma-semialdehyde dehydrogenase [Elusimicrobiota bacterium]|nr:L-glutamate gamma-semialdehyde dehydrogenase [Elusimicrobiota bacterium]
MRFKNEPPSLFSDPAARETLQRAIRDAHAASGATYPMIIDGEKVISRRTIRSVNPSDPSESVGLACAAGPTQADRAMESASRAFESWSRESQDDRALLLQRIAHRLRSRKPEFTAWLILEVGKSWAEADADVAEAIDFLEYYAEQSLLPPSALTPVASEKNRYRYWPLGPTVVIPPWNFPLAILVGMTAAAIVTGNTVILKPSSQSPIIAAHFVRLAEEAGLPAGVINGVPGAGAQIGDRLVSDPRVRMVAFTGSRAVGLRINALAGRTPPGQRWIKRVIAEMGGKNAIIVDDTADLDAAAQGVMASAFGFQGQKCSACSRAFIHRKVYDDFVERLLAKVDAIRIGAAEDLDNFMGPVISAAAKKSIERYIALGKREGRLLNAANHPDGNGYFVPPAVFDRLPDGSKLWSDEIFGPVLALAPVDSFGQAIVAANRSDYGLTGSVYSRDESRLRRAEERFFCGNLYFNRKSTGALVGGHPFGGFNMSGTDSKAGGPDYLMLFRQAQCVSQHY